MLKLTEEQVSEIFRERMIHDFPKAELKPLRSLIKAMRKGDYECYGMDRDGKLYAYAFFMHYGKDCLLDYFAVFSEYRGQGVGSDFLRQLRTCFQNNETVLLEAENPAFAADAAEQKIRERRIAFYLRNGCRDTGLTARTFSVEYRLLSLLGDNATDQNEIAETYRNVYRSFLPYLTYRRHVAVHTALLP